MIEFGAASVTGSLSGVQSEDSALEDCGLDIRVTKVVKHFRGPIIKSQMFKNGKINSPKSQDSHESMVVDLVPLSVKEAL